RQLKRDTVINVTDDNRDFLELCPLRRAPASFAGDDLVAAIRHRAHDNRLHNAMFLDRVGQVFEFGLGKMPARVARVRANELDRHTVIRADAWCSSLLDRLVHFTDESRKTASQSAP